jgi:hypothetical protein
VPEEVNKVVRVAPLLDAPELYELLYLALVVSKLLEDHRRNLAIGEMGGAV